MNKTYIVRLTDDERYELVQLTKSGKAAASKIKHAHILLHVDANGPNWSDAHVAKALHCHSNTVQRPSALCRTRSGGCSQKAGNTRASASWMARKKHLIALRCGPPPQGQAKLTLQLLADQLVALHVVETISYETVLVITDSVDLARHHSSSQKPVNSPANYRRSACR